MQAAPFSFGPTALTNTLSTNILNCNISSLSGPVGVTAQQPFVKINRITIVNKTSAAASFTLYKGATGANTAGTEIIGIATTVAANSANTYYGPWYLKVADFLVGGASAGTTLTIEGSGEVSFVAPWST